MRDLVLPKADANGVGSEMREIFSRDRQATTFDPIAMDDALTTLEETCAELCSARDEDRPAIREKVLSLAQAFYAATAAAGGLHSQIHCDLLIRAKDLKAPDASRDHLGYGGHVGWLREVFDRLPEVRELRKNEKKLSAKYLGGRRQITKTKSENSMIRFIEQHAETFVPEYCLKIKGKPNSTSISKDLIKSCKELCRQGATPYHDRILDRLNGLSDRNDFPGSDIRTVVRKIINKLN